MPGDAVQVKAETASSLNADASGGEEAERARLRVTFGPFLPPPVWLDGPMRTPEVPSLCGSATAPQQLRRSLINLLPLLVHCVFLLPFGSGIIYFLLTAASLRCILTAPPRCWSGHKFFHTLGQRLRSLWRRGLLGQRLLTPHAYTLADASVFM